MACSVPTEHIYLSVAPGLDICLTLHIDGQARATWPNRGVHLTFRKELKQQVSSYQLRGEVMGEKMEITSIKMQAL